MGKVNRLTGWIELWQNSKIPANHELILSINAKPRIIGEHIVAYQSLLEIA